MAPLPPRSLRHSPVFDKERRADCNLDTARRGAAYNWDERVP